MNHSRSRLTKFLKSFPLRLWRSGYRIGYILAPTYAVRHACDLFRTPPRRISKSGKNPEISPREIINAEGNAIALYSWGDPSSQPYVLFAHGWGGSGVDIAPWAGHLQMMGYAVIAFDQPAHGMSDGLRADLPKFVRTISIIGGLFGPPAAVIGHSLGCAAVAVAMSTDALAAKQAILIAASADLAAATHRFTDLMRMPKSMVSAMFTLFEREGIHFDKLHAEKAAADIDCPALVIHDAGDRSIPLDEGIKLARAWPGARLLTTRGLGHTRILTAPEVIEAGLSFLRGEGLGVSTCSMPETVDDAVIG